MSALTTEDRMMFPFPHQQEAIERIIAARVAEALAPIEALADRWDEGRPPGEFQDYYIAALRAAIASHYEGIAR